MIADIAEEQLADDGSGKSDGGNVTLGRRVGVCLSVELLQDGVDLANDTVAEGYLVRLSQGRFRDERLTDPFR